MKIEYTPQDIRTVYRRVVNKADFYCHKQKILDSIKCIRCASYLQYEFNDILCDERINNCIKLISESLFVKKDTPVIKNNYVFCDFAGQDNKGLTQQYLDALFSIEGISLLYIHESRLSDQSTEVKKQLVDNNATIIELGDLPNIEKSQKIYGILDEYKPEKCFCHFHPSTSIPFIIALYAFPQIVKYNINLTDHAFWLGGPDLFNYNFEFRLLGAKLSYERRGFKDEQLLMMPFYPWHASNLFNGLPDGCQEKIKILSGGAIYKIQGGDDLFLSIVLKLLKIRKDVVFLYAGAGDSHYITSFIQKNNLQDQMFYLGHRKDIYEVIKHIDIFLGTYPVGGGLMTQYAAIAGKPILTYKGYSIEKLLLPDKNHTIVYETEKELLEEAARLINDREYRNKKGEYYKQLIISQEKFRSNLKSLLQTHSSVDIRCFDQIIYYNDMYKSYLDRINDKKKLTIELPIIKSTHSVLHWKILVNTLMNLNKIRKCKK